MTDITILIKKLSVAERADDVFEAYFLALFVDPSEYYRNVSVSEEISRFNVQKSHEILDENEAFLVQVQLTCDESFFFERLPAKLLAKLFLPKSLSLTVALRKRFDVALAVAD